MERLCWVLGESWASSITAAASFCEIQIIIVFQIFQSLVHGFLLEGLCRLQFLLKPFRIIRCEKHIFRVFIAPSPSSHGLSQSNAWPSKHSV